MNFRLSGLVSRVHLLGALMLLTLLTTQAIAALLDEDSSRLSSADWERLSAQIKRARKEGA